MTTFVIDSDPSVMDADTVTQLTRTDPERGLTAHEAARRLAESGPNEMVGVAPVPRWRKFVQHFRDPLIYLLLAASVISLAAWLIEGAVGWPFDAIVITVIVLLNAVLGYVQQAKAEHAVEALQRMAATMATVVRDGEPTKLPTAELVPGDLLILSEGDTVAADARLLTAATLKVSEASLTGESEAVLKDARTLPEPAALGDRFNMVFKGTAVTQGAGRAVVTATGMATQMGQIADLLYTTQEDPTPLQREIALVGRMLGTAVLVIAAVVITTIFLFFGVDTAEDVVTTLLLGVSLAVAAVPEGLPAILSVVLALGVQRMAARNAIVKNLSSVETLGSASVVCTDKTGTLTKGEMTIGRVVTASGETKVTGVGYRPDGRVEHNGQPLTEGSMLWQETAFVLSGGSLASDATLRETDGVWVVHGDPTEGAFLAAEVKLGTRDRRAERFQRVGEIPFTSDRRLMTSVESDAQRAGKIAVVTKGAPDTLVERCSYIQVGDLVAPLDNTWRARIQADVERLSDDAFRTLAVAYRRLEVADMPSWQGPRCLLSSSRPHAACGSALVLAAIPLPQVRAS